MTKQAWHKPYDNFETTQLLDAVGHIDTLRGHLSDRELMQPPQIRDDLLELHRLAMDVVNSRQDDQLSQFASLAATLQDQTVEMLLAVKAIHTVLDNLVVLLPDDALDDELHMESK